MSQSPLVIVGLGNPGEKYAGTRHNFGARVVQAFAHEQGLPFSEEKKFKAHVAKGDVGGRSVYLMLPTTYMNESGVAVEGLLNFYKLPKESVIIVVDDIALAFGQLRLREAGSAGGHNGLKSIERHLGTQEYLRLRLGIDRKQPERELSDYVLDRFTSEEREILPAIVARATGALKELLSKKPEEVMNQLNPKLEKKNGTKAEEKPL